MKQPALFMAAIAAFLLGSCGGDGGDSIRSDTSEPPMGREAPPAVPPDAIPPKSSTDGIKHDHGKPDMHPHGNHKGQDINRTQNAV